MNLIRWVNNKKIVDYLDTIIMARESLIGKICKILHTALILHP